MNKILIIILILGFLLRVVNINDNPRALYGDELTLVYDAYSILKTGHDQKGNFLPITFEMAGGRPGGYVYATIPFVAIFGPTALAARSVSILSGLGIIFLIYVLGKQLLDSRVGILASFLVAISPWDLALSRGGFETHFALFLTLLGMTSFIQSFKKPWLLIISACAFGLSFHTYSTYKFTIPIIVLLLLYFKDWKQLLNEEHLNFAIISSIFLALFVAVLVWQILLGASERRFLSINVFSQGDLQHKIIQKINLERGLDQMIGSLSNLFHNKLAEYGLLIGTSYINNFSTDFLFLHGDRNPRHNPALMGQLFLVEFITLLFGLASLAKNTTKKTLIFIISWLLIAPIPTALLLEPHALRSSLMLPPLLLISASGLSYLWSLPKHFDIKFIKIVLITGFILQFLVIVDRVYFLSPNQFSRFWSNPAKIASKKALQESSNYQNIILSDRVDNIEFAYPVYAKIDPNIVIASNQKKNILGDFSFKKFDNVYIGYIPDSAIENFINSLNGSTLYIGPENDSKFLHNFESINDLDGERSLVIEKSK